MIDKIFKCYYSLENINENAMYSLIDDIKSIKIHKLLEMNSLISNQFVFLIFKKNNSIYINIFRKNYNPYLEGENKWEQRGFYIITIILNNETYLHEPYDWFDIESEYELLVDDSSINNNTSESGINNVNTEDISDNEEDDKEEIDLMLSLSDIFYETYYHDNINYVNLEESYEFLDGDIYTVLYNNINGLYFNINDIRWQIAIKELLCSYIGGCGKYIKYFNYKSFSRKYLYECYYIDYNKDSIYERYIYNNSKIECDLCNNIINNVSFYHNPECGDLCDKCYLLKKKSDIIKIKNYWKIVLNEGKKKTFKRDLELTKEFIKSKRIKRLSIYKRYNLLKNVNNILLKKRNSFCGICLNQMIDNLYSGKCGHCFHKNCIEQWNHLECPMCRINTHFIKLYI